MALLNLGSADPNLRSAAYNLLCALTQTFDLKIDGQLLQSDSLCIPSNNTIFIKQISEKLATNASHLTCEFLEECIQGFCASSIELKHLCLEYISPWLPNLTRFCRHSDDAKRQRVATILDKLITLTIQEVQMYPSIQAKIWGNIGQIADLLDMVLDSFIKRSVTGGLGSVQAEIMADTAVALASANVKLVASKVITRLCRVIEKTCTCPTATLEQHLMWDEIAILARHLLMLSFNNCLDVASHLPYLFHIVTLLVHTGPISLRASIHGLVINLVHSLCTCTRPTFSGDAQRILRLCLDEFSLPKFYLLFGISKVKSPAVTAFRSAATGSASLSCRSNSCNNSYWWSCPLPNLASSNSIGSFDSYRFADLDDRIPLGSLEIVTDALLEILESCMKQMPPDCDWLDQWTQMAKMFAFRYNPALQPRAIIVYGCITKTVTDGELKELLRILVRALESFQDLQLIDAIIMGLTRLQPLLPAGSPIHTALFWVAVSVMQLDEMDLYTSGLALLEQNLHTLDSHGVFESNSLAQVMMSAREPLEWHFKQLDNSVGLSYRSNFHFALVGHLIKGYRHPASTTISRTIRILNTLLSIVAKSTQRDKFEVSPDSVAYLSALLPVSDEAQSRCHLRHRIARLVSESPSTRSFTNPSAHITTVNTKIIVPVFTRRQKSCQSPNQSKTLPLPSVSTSVSSKSWQSLDMDNTRHCIGRSQQPIYLSANDSTGFKTHRSSSMPSTGTGIGSNDQDDLSITRPTENLLQLPEPVISASPLSESQQQPSLIISAAESPVSDCEPRRSLSSPSYSDTKEINENKENVFLNPNIINDDKIQTLILTLWVWL